MAGEGDETEDALLKRISQSAKLSIGSQGSKDFHAANLLNAIDGSAQLLARLSRKAEKQTKRIIRLTWALLVLTAVILVIAIWDKNSISSSRYEFRTFSGLPMRIDKKTGRAEIIRPELPSASKPAHGPWEDYKSDAKFDPDAYLASKKQGIPTTPSPTVARKDIFDDLIASPKPSASSASAFLDGIDFSPEPTVSPKRPGKIESTPH